MRRDVTSATRVTNVYSFVSVITGVCLGLVVRKVRRLKWFVVAGTCFFVLAFGLLLRYRGGSSTADFAGIIAGEVILGIAGELLLSSSLRESSLLAPGGMFPYPTQVLIQAAVQHERTAVMTGLYLASSVILSLITEIPIDNPLRYSIGSAIGNTIAAGIWTNTMPTHIANNLLAQGINNATLAADLYASPLTYVAIYPVGTPVRTALNDSFREVQRYLCIAGISISSLLVFVSLALKNPRLGDGQSFTDAEGFDVTTLPTNGGTTNSVRRAESDRIGDGDEKARDVI